MAFLTDFPADLERRECEASGCNTFKVGDLVKCRFLGPDKEIGTITEIYSGGILGIELNSGCGTLKRPEECERVDSQNIGAWNFEGCNCGQTECFPARQFNRTVELDTARTAAVAKWSEGEALTRYYVNFAKVIDTLFGGDKP